MAFKPLVVRFKFPDFESLPSQPNDSTKSTVVTTSRDHDWQLHLYPGGPIPILNGEGIGEEDEDVHRGEIGLYLKKIRGDEINATIAITVRDADDNAYHRCGDNDIARFGAAVNPMGYYNLVKRSEILASENNVLVGGALIVDVEIQEVSEKDKIHPENPFVHNMLKLLENEDGADVAFKVGDAVVPAHKLILKMNAPMLFSLCDERDGGSPIPVEGTSPKVFRHVLRYVYGGGEPKPREVRETGRDLMDAADRFGAASLKVAVEAAIVEMRVMNVENVVDWILFAHARSCPLLKEYATSYFSGVFKDVLAHESSRRLLGAPVLMKELMIAISNEASSFIDDASAMDVDELRINSKRRAWMSLGRRKCSRRAVRI